MRALIALDEGSERVAAAVGSWTQSEGVAVKLLWVLEPKDVHATAAPSGFTHALTPAGQPSGQLLNVSEPPPRLAEDRSQAFARSTAEHNDYLIGVAERYLPGVPAEVEVRVGEDIAAVIIEEAGVHGADVIVMGTRSRTGISRALLGSIAERVVRDSPVPVLLVGPQARVPEGTPGT